MPSFSLALAFFFPLYLLPLFFITFSHSWFPLPFPACRAQELFFFFFNSVVPAFHVKSKDYFWACFFFFVWNLFEYLKFINALTFFSSFFFHSYQFSRYFADALNVGLKTLCCGFLENSSGFRDQKQKFESYSFSVLNLFSIEFKRQINI